MKKLCLLLVILALFITGCDKKIYHWEFDYSETRIVEIKIVEFSDYYQNEYTVLKEIDREHFAELYSDIQKLEMTRYAFNLSHPVGRCFLINFENGEYDVISSKEPKRCRYVDGKITGYNSWLRCNTEQLENLFAKYLTE